MRRSPASPPRRTRLLPGVLLLAALAFPGLPVEAATPATRIPILNRLGQALFPTADPGYLPSVGSPAIRLHEGPTTVPIKAPPVALYAVPEPPAPAAPDPAKDGADAPPHAVETPPAVVLGDRKPPPVRPEDFLPYFQLNDGSSRGAPAEGVQFTPARPELPSSQAEYRQQ